MGLAAENHKRNTPSGNEAQYMLALKRTFDSIYLSKRKPSQKRSSFISTTATTKNKKRIPPAKRKRKRKRKMISRALFWRENYFRERRGDRKRRGKRQETNARKINKPTAKNKEKHQRKD